MSLTQSDRMHMTDWNPAKERKEYLAEWLRLRKSAEDAAPDVQREYELAAFEADLMDSIQLAGAPAEVTNDLGRRSARSLEAVKRAFPHMPDYGAAR